jgi:hypothetical protein
VNAVAGTSSRPPTRDDYVPIVLGLWPKVGEEELKLRTNLLWYRDRAMATKPIACEQSWALLDVVEREANSVALDPRVDQEALREILRLLALIVGTAFGFDKLYSPTIPGLIDGEAKA